MCAMSGIRIRRQILSVDPSEFQNITRTCPKTRLRWTHISAKLLPSVLSRNVKESFNKVLDADPWADEFKNLISSSPDWWLPVCEDWLLWPVHYSSLVREQTNTRTHIQTNKQTNATDQPASRIYVCHVPIKTSYLLTYLLSANNRAILTLKFIGIKVRLRPYLLYSIATCFAV